MPCSFTSENYLNSSAPPYTYYVCKHNPTIVYDSVATVPSRLARHRNFNDLAADLNATAIPQWVFITPNMVDDGQSGSLTTAECVFVTSGRVRGRRGKRREQETQGDVNGIID